MENKNRKSLSEEIVFELRLKAGKKNYRYENSMCIGPEARKSQHIR